MKDRVDYYTMMIKATTAGLLFVVVVSLLALIVAVTSDSKSDALVSVTEYVSSGPLRATSVVQSLSGAGAPLQLQLPNDLRPLKGRTFRVYSTTAQPHTLVIGDGPIGSVSTWDGVAARTATLGGAPLDGLTFHIQVDGSVVVTHTRNVVFT